MLNRHFYSFKLLACQLLYKLTGLLPDCGYKWHVQNWLIDIDL